MDRSVAVKEEEELLQRRRSYEAWSDSDEEPAAKQQRLNALLIDTLEPQLLAKLTAMAGERSKERLSLEFNVWKAISSIYADDGWVKFTLEFGHRVKVDKNVYALVAKVRDAKAYPPYLPTYGLQAKVLQNRFMEQEGMYERTKFLHAHEIKDESINSQMYYEKGKPDVMLAFVERLIETLTLLHKYLSDANTALYNDLEKSQQEKVTQTEEKMWKRIDPETVASTPVLPRKSWDGKNFYSGTYNDTLKNKSVQQRLFEMKVYFIVNWLFHGEHMGGFGYDSITVSIRACVCPYNCKELPKVKGDEVNLDCFYPVTEEVKNVAKQLPTKAQVGIVRVDKVCRLLQGGRVAKALALSRFAAGAIQNAIEKLREAVHSLKMSEEDAKAELWQLTERFGIGASVSF